MKLIRTALIAAAMCVALAGCGDDDELTDVSTSSSQAQSEGSESGQDEASLNRASGEVAEVSGSTAQVQGDGSQVAVTWTEATTFTAEQVGTLADLEVGSCVMVASAASSDGTGTESADGTDASAAQAIAAGTVRVISAGADGCTMPGGLGAGSGGPGDGERPSGMPSDLPSDLPEGEGGPGGAPGGRGQIGEITAVGTDGFTLVSSMPRPGDGTQESGGSTTGEPSTVDVTVADDTVITVTVDADADAVTVGSCVNADGERSGTGTLTATTVAVTQQVDGSCQRGVGGGRPGGAAGPGGSDDDDTDGSAS